MLLPHRKSHLQDTVAKFLGMLMHLIHSSPLRRNLQEQRGGGLLELPSLGVAGISHLVPSPDKGFVKKQLPYEMSIIETETILDPLSGMTDIPSLVNL